MNSEGSASISSQGNGVAALLQRMRAGDRTAAALFVTTYGSRITRRIRGKLGSSTMRSVYDSHDVLATLARRLDEILLAGTLQASSEPQLWALVHHIAEKAVQEKARARRRARRRELQAAGLASRPCRGGREREAAGFDVDSALRCLDTTDRQIVCRWLAGSSLAGIASMIGLAPAALRKRWERIRGRLRVRLESEGFP